VVKVNFKFFERAMIKKPHFKVIGRVVGWISVLFSPPPNTKCLRTVGAIQERKDSLKIPLLFE
jgi:predicted nucleic acid binding AN1-type Zn finger protein